jgi:hypothetical protein
MLRRLKRYYFAPWDGPQRRFNTYCWAFLLAVGVIVFVPWLPIGVRMTVLFLGLGFIVFACLASLIGLMR